MCATGSLLVQVTVVPFGTVIWAGLNANPLISTFAPETGTGAAAGGGGGIGALEPVPPVSGGLGGVGFPPACGDEFEAFEGFDGGAGGSWFLPCAPVPGFWGEGWLPVQPNNRIATIASANNAFFMKTTPRSAYTYILLDL